MQSAFTTILCAFILALGFAVSLASPLKNSDFTLQIAAYQTLLEAEAAQKSFLFNGLETEIYFTEAAGRGKIFRLRAGRFVNPESARVQAEKWLAAGKINSYWITKLEPGEQRYVQLTSSAATTRNGAVADSAVKIAIDQKKMPEIGLGHLLAALDGKWGVRVPDVSAMSAKIVFPKAGIIKPVIVFLNDAMARSVAPTNLNSETSHALEIRFEPGLKISQGAHSLDHRNAAKLIGSLRYISGYKDLLFDERGYLVLGERIEGGSDLARALLSAAIKSKEVFEIEGYNNSDVVVFGALLTAEFPSTQHERVLFNRIQLDFSDFEKLQGDPQALAAFDPGFVFLHELTHGVKKLADDSKYSGVGECESFINQIRQQLGLPARLHYYFKIKHGEIGTEKGELLFLQLPRNEAEREKYMKLIWDHSAVGTGGLITPNVVKGK